MYPNIESKYSYVKDLGVGAHGKVFLAKHKHLGTLQAIKELTPKNKIEKSRISREIDILTTINHPHVIQINEVIQHNNNTYICMEYASHGSLREVIKKDAPFSSDKTMYFISGILKGLQSLHAHNIIHRDIKPENILLGQHYIPKIADLGIAKITLNNQSALTRSNNQLGTIGYMAPEQLQSKSKEIDHQSDIYAVGVIMYELLTGKHPFNAENDLISMRNCLQGSMTPLSHLNPSVDPHLEHICSTALSVKKQNRFPSAQEMLEALQETNSIRGQSLFNSTTYTRSQQPLHTILLGSLSAFSLVALYSIYSLSPVHTHLNSFSSQHAQLEQTKQEILHAFPEQIHEANRRLTTSIRKQLYNTTNNMPTNDVLYGTELFKLGMIHYNGVSTTKNYLQAIHFFEQSAQRNNPQALSMLGYMHDHGEEFKKDHNKATHYYLLAAQQNDPDSCFLYAQRFHHGVFVKKDIPKALTWYETAAKLKHKKAQELLYDFYLYHPKYKDYKKAFSTLLKQAEQNDHQSLFHLGTMFQHGWHIQKNIPTSTKYFIQSMKYGNPDAARMLYKLSSQPNAPQFIHKEIYTWFMNQLEQNDPTTLFYIGFIHEHGIHTKKNTTKAIHYYNKAIHNNHTAAMFQLANLYLNTPHSQDKEKAIPLLTQAGENTHLPSLSLLGQLYENGTHITKDITKAIFWYTQAANQGDVTAMKHLAQLYFEHNLIKNNISLATSWLSKAVEYEDTEAMYKLADLYLSDESSTNNYQKGFELCLQAAQHNHTQAQLKVAQIYSQRSSQQDLTNAIHWYTQAAEKNNTIAMSQLGLLYTHDRSKNLSLAHKWLTQAYKHNQNKETTYALAQLYFTAGKFYNQQKGISFLKKAIKLQHSQALYDLGKMYYHGTHTKQNKTLGLKLLQRAANNTHTQAIFELGSIYYKKSSQSHQDRSRAISWLTTSANHNNTQAMMLLATLYSTQSPQQFVKARNYYQRAADLGAPEAYFFLGTYYKEGKGGKQDINRAHDYLLKAVKNHHLPAFVELGVFYEKKILPIPNNFKKAFDLYLQAAQKNYAPSFTYLGHLYQTGQGTPQDFSQALFWYTKALQHKDDQAMTLLGSLYERGQGVAKSYTKAFKYYKQAAQLDNLQALYALGILYQEGKGTKKNMQSAFDCFTQAAKSNHPKSLVALGLFYNKGFSPLSSADHSKAFELITKAYHLDNSDAKFHLARLYFEGQGTQQDKNKGIQFFKDLAQNNHLDSLLALGDIYISPTGFNNKQLAITYYNKAIQLGSTDALYKLGKLHQNKPYLTLSTQTKAIPFFKQAAQANHPHALYELGYAYSRGFGLKQNYSKALQLLEQAAKLKNKDAMYELGNLYYHDKGVPQDLSTSFFWYKQAADLGHISAKKQAAHMLTHGHGTQADEALAIKYYQESGKQDANALDALGDYYLRDNLATGSKADIPKALDYFKQAAQMGSFNAIESILLTCQRHDGYDHEIDEAINICKLRAQKNDYMMMYRLGEIYFDKEHKRQDYSKAYKWYLEYLQHNPFKPTSKALYSLGFMYEHGYGAQQNFTQALSYYQQAATNYVSSASPSNINAIIQLASMYETGKGVTIDKATSFKWYTTAAKENHYPSMVKIGKMYRHGEGTKKDYSKALHWFTQASKRIEQVEAFRQLADMYYKGEGVKKSYKEAALWLKKAVDRQDPKSFYPYARMYHTGEIGSINFMQAMRYYRLAITHDNNHDAMYQLGLMYYTGKGVGKNLRTASRYFKDAERLGNKKAKSILKLLRNR